MRIKPRITATVNAPDDEVDAKLKKCVETVTGNARDFVLSLQDQWQSKGFLTEKQVSALNKFTQKLKKKFVPQGAIQDEYILTMLDDCLASKTLDQGAHEFLVSLAEYFETRGYLTENQYNALLRFHNGV